jgi:predicted small secreted protein
MRSSRFTHHVARLSSQLQVSSSKSNQGEMLMFKRRLMMLCSILAVLSIVIAACAPAGPAGEPAASEEAAAPAAGVAVAPAGEITMTMSTRAG